MVAPGVPLDQRELDLVLDVGPLFRVPGDATQHTGVADGGLFTCEQPRGWMNGTGPFGGERLGVV